MNVERILAVADAIENNSIPELKFDMRHFYTLDTDGTSIKCCIAGYAIHMFSEIGGHINETSCVRYVLEIDCGQKIHDLVYMVGYILLWEKVTRQDVAKVLRNLVKTGEVDWSEVIAREEAQV